MPRDGKLRTPLWGLSCTEGRQPCLLLSHTPHQQRGMTTSQRGTGSGADSRVKRKCFSPPLQGRSGRPGSKSSGGGGVPTLHPDTWEVPISSCFSRLEFSVWFPLCPGLCPAAPDPHGHSDHKVCCTPGNIFLTVSLLVLTEGRPPIVTVYPVEAGGIGTPNGLLYRIPAWLLPHHPQPQPSPTHSHT